MNENTSTAPENDEGQDIIFDCPNCGKSLCIEESGAGRVVPCPDCGTRMQVPIPERMQQEMMAPGLTTMADYTAARESAPGGNDAARARVESGEGSVEELQARKRELEKMRIDNALRFSRIREEMASIQAALDRMTDILQNTPNSGR